MENASGASAPGRSLRCRWKRSAGAGSAPGFGLTLFCTFMHRCSRHVLLLGYRVERGWRELPRGCSGQGAQAEPAALMVALVMPHGKGRRDSHVQAVQPRGCRAPNCPLEGGEGAELRHRPQKYVLPASLFHPTPVQGLPGSPAPTAAAMGDELDGGHKPRGIVPTGRAWAGAGHVWQEALPQGWQLAFSHLVLVGFGL